MRRWMHYGNGVLHLQSVTYLVPIELLLILSWSVVITFRRQPVIWIIKNGFDIKMQTRQKHSNYINRNASLHDMNTLSHYFSKRLGEWNMHILQKPKNMGNRQA